MLYSKILQAMHMIEGTFPPLSYFCQNSLYQRYQGFNSIINSTRDSNETHPNGFRGEIRVLGKPSISMLLAA